jgi:hypothetical protein
VDLGNPLPKGEGVSPHPGFWQQTTLYLTASQKVHLLRCASSFVIAAHFYVRLIPQPAC